MTKIVVVLVMAVFLLFGCGGGGGSGSDISQVKVVLSSSRGDFVGKLSGIEVTLQLPTGVTPGLATDGSLDISMISGSGILGNKDDYNLYKEFTTYTPATGAAPGLLSFVISSATTGGFDFGEFATVVLNKSSHISNFTSADQSNSGGTSAITTEYKVTSFSLVDMNPSVVSVSNFAIPPKVTFAVEAL